MEMKALRTLALVPFLALALAPASLAQRGPATPEQMKERMATQVEEVITKLALSGDKAESVRLVLMAQGEKSMQLRTRGRRARGEGQQQATNGEGRGNRAAMGQVRERMQALNEETLSLLSEILTEDELTKYAEIQAERAPRRRRGNASIQ